MIYKVEYKVVYKDRYGKTHVVIFGAVDRKDAIDYTLKNYKVKRIVSATLANAAAVRRERKARAAAPVPTPEPVLTEGETFAKMLAEAYATVKLVPYSGIAIGKYLKLFMSDDPTFYDIACTVKDIIRIVDNYNETLIQNRKAA